MFGPRSDRYSFQELAQISEVKGGRDLVALNQQLLLGEFKKLVQKFQCRFTYVEFSGLSAVENWGGVLPIKDSSTGRKPLIT